jgi:hypothetical protein
VNGIKNACSGSTWSNASSASCSPCTSGYSCSSGLRSPCLVGSYSNEGDGVCAICLGGMYTNTTGKGVCHDCEVGNACVGGIRTPCMEGAFTSSPRSTSCIPSPPGFYVPYTGASSPTVCPDGKYSQVRATECFDCPSGNAIHLDLLSGIA